MSGYTDKIYLKVSQAQLDWFETNFDNQDPASGVFVQTGLVDEDGDYYCTVDTASPDFGKFSEGFRANVSRYFRKPQYAQDPEYADFINLYNRLEHPDTFTLTASAGPKMTAFLGKIFKEGETMFVKGDWKRSDKPLNRVRFQFDPSRLTDDQEAQLKKFHDSLKSNTDDEILQKYGPDYMNLLVFARENVEGLSPLPEVLTETRYPDKMYLQVTKDKRDFIETFDDNDPDSGAFVQTGFTKAGKKDDGDLYFCYVNTASPEFSQRFRDSFAEFVKTPEYQNDYSQHPKNLSIINLYEMLVYRSLKRSGDFTTTISAGPKTTADLKQIFREGKTLFVEGTFEKFERPLNRIRISFTGTHLSADEQAQLKKFRDWWKDKKGQKTADDLLQSTFGINHLNLLQFAEENLVPGGEYGRDTMKGYFLLKNGTREETVAWHPAKKTNIYDLPAFDHLSFNSAFWLKADGSIDQSRVVKYDLNHFTYLNDRLYISLSLQEPAKKGDTLLLTFVAPEQRMLWLKAVLTQDVPSDGHLDELEEKNYIPVLIKELKDTNPDVRSVVAGELGEIRPVAKEAVLALAESVLKDADPDVRSAAAKALGEIGPAAKEVVFALAESVLKDPDSDVRDSAVTALGKIGPAAKEAVPALIKALKDPDGDVRDSAAWALGEIGPAAKEAVPALIEALKDADRFFYSSAARVLGEIGPAAKEAVPALIEALKDPNPHGNDRQWAAWALGEIGPVAKEAVPALAESVLKDADPVVRSEAASALGEIGPVAKEAVPALIEALKDADPVVRSAAAWALGKMGSAAKEAVPALIEVAIKDRESYVHYSAVRALGEMGPTAKEAVPILTEIAQKDPDPDFRSAAEKALERIKQETEKAAPGQLEMPGSIEN